jgi:hypothetical protein
MYLSPSEIRIITFDGSYHIKFFSEQEKHNDCRHKRWAGASEA